MEEEVKIISINPETFETQDYTTSDQNLLTVSELNTNFNKSTDYIEICIYDESQNKIYSTPEGEVLTNYSVKEGDILLNPEQDLRNLTFDIDAYFINYNFYRQRLGSNSSLKYFIKELSSDRTELKISSNQIPQEDIISSTDEFISYRENADYFVDFSLNFGLNQILIANNIKIDGSDILVKLYEPLPPQFDVKSLFWVVEEISTPQSYKVTFPFIVEVPNDFSYISGPNFNLNVKSKTGESSQEFSYNTLLSSNITSSVNQIKSLLNEKEININIDYNNFNNFVHFSSANTRLENFYYKVGLIESLTNQISSSLGQITTSTNTTIAYSSSKALLVSQIEDTIKSFDGYEYFLYFNSGSSSYPKSNTTPPFQLQSTGSTEVLNWIGSADPDSPYYGGVALSASNYDENNKDYLYWAIPEYLRNDPDNSQYELFIDMVGQHYDNIWLYTKDITNKFDADNRLEYGISKDLVAEAIKDFGVKLYSNGFNTNDLFTAFLGITPSGSTFPFPEMTGNLPASTGYEYVNTNITASSNVIPLDDVNKRLYKRIYHNIPYLLKTKGTIVGLKSLITSYGIPDTILRINEFGGKDKNENQDWDLEQNIYNKAHTTINNSTGITTRIKNNSFYNSVAPARSIQLRFKPSPLPSPVNNTPSPDIVYSQSIGISYAGTTVGGALVLEYTGSGLITGSYSGSTIDPKDYYGTLKWIPSQNSPTISSSVYLPFFNNKWWSIQINTNGVNLSSSLYVSSTIDGKVAFTGSNSASGFTPTTWNDSSRWGLNRYDLSNNISGKNYEGYLGEFQELRFYSQEISQSGFYHYVLNPYSIEGNGNNTSPDSLFFRTSLGSELDLGNTSSIHPRSTGSSEYKKPSFENGTSEIIQITPVYVNNTEKIYQNQVPAGIKNRVTDKISIGTTILAESPSGSNSDITALSPLRSIQQNPSISQSYTDGINYLEVAFSPQDQINDDINTQLGYFNIGEYIGDPRQISSSNTSYPNLDTLRDTYFNKYSDSYDVKDFIRLIKFFDNSLFKMIKDFTPARTSLSAGVVVKQHILERNRQRPAQVSFSNQSYSGSVKSKARGYNTGSGDTGQYEAENGSSIYKFSGGAGGSLERYNGLQTSPSASQYGLSNQFGLTQSFTETVDGPLGPREVLDFSQREFYTGEFSGANIVVTTQSLSPECSPYLKVSDTSVTFNPIFFSFDRGSITQGTVTSTTFTDNKNIPNPGDAWIASELGNVVYIKLSSNDVNNLFIRDYLSSSNILEVIFPDSNLPNGRTVTKYYIEGVITYSTHVLIIIKSGIGDTHITGSTNGGSENWSLVAQGDYNTNGIIPPDSNDNIQQGHFTNVTKTSQFQNIFHWNGNIVDPLSFFNTGSESGTTSKILNGIVSYNNSSYNPLRTSNVPWFFSCSIAYSASSLGTITDVTSSGIYHSGSLTGGDQDLEFTSNGQSGTYIPTPKAIDLNSEYFTTNLNPNNLGNQGSGDGVINPNNSGHPQIRQAGTASLDFYFPSLSLAGTTPTTSSGTPDFTPLSASALIGGNGNFSSTFNESFLGFATDGITKDGAITLDYDDLKTHLEGNGYASPVVIFGTSYSFNGSFNTNVTNITASFFNSRNGGGYNAIGSPILSNAQGNIPSFLNHSITGAENQKLRWQVKSPISENLEYTVGTFSADLTVQFTANSVFNSTTFTNILNNYIQAGNNNEFTSSFIPGTETSYATIDLQVNLKSTGSNGERILTSSNILSGVDIHEGKTFTFPDSPILGIRNVNPLSATRTLNEIGEMYFLEYSLSNYTEGVGGQFEDTEVQFENDNTGNTKINISQSFELSSVGFDATGSLRISKGSPTNISDAQIIENFPIASETSVDRVNIIGSFDSPFTYNDTFRMGIGVSKSLSSGLTITEYTMSIFPSSSRFAPLSTPPSLNNYKTPTSSNFILEGYYGEDILPFDKALDCQPLLNNYNSQRSSTNIFDVDYSIVSGSYIPINLNGILNRTATKATTPDSNYTMQRSIRPRYNGTKTTSLAYNLFTEGGDTFGKLPPVEYKNAFFGYFNAINDPYPVLNGKTRLNLTSLIDQDGNAIPPSLNGVGFSTLSNTFPLDKPTSISTDSGIEAMNDLNGFYLPFKITKNPTPILYTQNSAYSFSNNIPFTGSDGAILDAGVTLQEYSFVAAGTSSFYNDYGSLTNLPFGEYTQSINPTENVISGSLITSSYNPSTGLTVFPNTDEGDGDIAMPHKLSLETSFVTSFLYESYSRSGGIFGLFQTALNDGQELKFEVQLLSGSAGLNFDLEDISLRVHKGTTSIDLGSILNTSNDVVRFISSEAINSGTTQNTPRYNSFRDSYVVTVENGPLNNFMSSRGVYTPGTGGIQSKGDITGLEWKIKANSGGYSFKKEDEIKWFLRIILAESTEPVGSNTLFPSEYTGPIMPTTITLQSNTTASIASQSPYWVFTGSAGGGSNILDRSVLVMSSSIVNEAYSKGFTQGEIPYTVGPSSYFAGGIEPEGTSIGRPKHSIILQENDEIRFSNNESFNYKILKVTSPGENLEDGEPRLKIQLDKPVPGNINKNFFLIRRYEDNANTFILDNKFPYGTSSTASSSPGIIFPNFPTDNLENSASLIVTNLIDKGVIK